MSITLKLTREQRRVALERALQKQPPAPQPLAGMPPQPGMMPQPGMPPMGMPQPGMAPPQMGMPPTGTTPPPPGAANMMPGAPEMPGLPGMAPPAAPYLRLPPEKGSMELTPVEEQIQAALIADQLWKVGGGSKSIGARVWSDLAKSSGSRHLETPHDYFVSSFVKWSNDPVKFKKMKPREANLIEQLAAVFGETSE